MIAASDHVAPVLPRSTTAPVSQSVTAATSQNVTAAMSDSGTATISQSDMAATSQGDRARMSHSGMAMMSADDMASMSHSDKSAASGSNTAPPVGGLTTPATGHGGNASGESAEMPGLSDLTDPMSREGSGTSWQPDSSPLFGYMQMGRNGEMSMEHFAAYARYVDVGSQRGSRRLDAPNWFMGMHTVPLTKNSQLGMRAMVSLDPLTENGSGYPLLFQTGETWHGAALHDHQHPHDLFSELSATYSRRLGQQSAAYFYAGYPGEPALGPPTFMHRRIAYDLADAPIGHHWQDSTHVTFGVATIGIVHGKVKVEGSSFTGREPDAVRTNFDPIHLDSYSTRISWNAGRNIAAQISEGYVHSPEALTPLIDVHRSTASLLYNHAIGDDRNFYAALVYGQNHESDNTRSNSYLAEFDYQQAKNTYFGRLERIGKSGAELVLPLTSVIYEITQSTIGYVHDISRNTHGLQTGLGLQFSTSLKPATLDAFYGHGTPISFGVFVRVRPPELRGMRYMGAMPTMPTMTHESPVRQRQ